jgi:crotonobetaine/carnitine-CoA ligase
MDSMIAARTTKPNIELSWWDEASVIYTSGTTGRPNGVVLPQRWIFANYVAYPQLILNGDDVVHTSLPLYHVAGLYADIVAGMVAGATISLWDRFSSSAFWDRIDQFGATRVNLLSVMISWLAKQPESKDDRYNTLNKVHMQPLPDNYETIARRFGFDFVTVAYGQTETGLPIWGIVHAARGDDATPPSHARGKSPEAVVRAVEEEGIPAHERVPG